MAVHSSGSGGGSCVLCWPGVCSPYEPARVVQVLWALARLAPEAGAPATLRRHWEAALQARLRVVLGRSGTARKALRYRRKRLRLSARRRRVVAAAVAGVSASAAEGRPPRRLGARSAAAAG
jgi:hypothetical protein